MNKPDLNRDVYDAPAPLVDFESAWVETLRQPDARTPDQDEAFVAQVMGALDQADHEPAVPEPIEITRPLRIRPAWLPYAAAAAFALFAMLGYAWFVQPSDAPTDQNIAGESPIVQPDEADPVDTLESSPARPVRLGALISQAQGTVTGPTEVLTQGVSQGVTQAPGIIDPMAVLDLIDAPMPGFDRLLNWNTPKTN